MPLGSPERILVLAPRGRDAAVACALLREAGMAADPVADMETLECLLAEGAGAAVVTDEALLDADLRRLSAWVEGQPPWSDFPFIVLTGRGGGLERNPAIGRLQRLLGNVALIERPFHPTTLASAALTAVRGRRRQYEARARLAELGELNATLERRVAEELSERLGAQADLQQAQKMEAIGQLTGGVAHDFNNLLQAVGACFQLIGRKVSDPSVLPLLEAGQQAVDRGGKLTQQLMGFARRQPLRTEAVDVRDQLLSMSGLLSRTLRADIHLAVDLEPGLWPVQVDPTQFELAVINLAVNARDAMPCAGELRVTARNADLPGGGVVRLTIADTGSGMPPEVLARVFEPFFTTKAVGKGTGLGLSQVHGFARQSRGTVEVQSTPGSGTAVTLVLPRSHAVPTRAVGASDAPTGGRPLAGVRILMVEDDPLVGVVVAAALAEAGFTVRHATTAEEALGWVDGGLDFDLLFTDVVMPGTLNGVDLARAVRERRPGVPVLLCTGYNEDVASVDGSFHVLAKPYRFDSLLRAIADELNAAPLCVSSQASPA